MTTATSLRERKKQETRGRLATVAARLFAEHGYDAVSMSDVARAAGVADQTVYNYFPTKPDLVLDRADQMLERSCRAVAERDPSLTPADALRDQVHDDIDRFLARDPFLARGEYPTQSVVSDALRRYALQFRHAQAAAIAATIRETDPEINELVALAHATVLVTVIQTVTDRIGAVELSDADLPALARELHEDAEATLADAAENFRATKARAVAGARRPR
ncbi:helix-turn-helix domain-containing protein [Curtobacterium sp. MCLR17_007]|uniref:TetR/AcrR family transcriptional regulator n=1 Tax=Curtobacterium sp. MCLR17_007 TaxID=2175648 RepID=UPI000DA86323|nr:TetR/AcrR family transcriptional regulator [Curtobacterium sp. MCLR17_007]WIB60185.1 helix-turn-helix domain-containing protein [Curtobacterium sp. MCLR17_007]